MERKWWLVIAGCITHAVNTGFSYFGMSAFFPSFEREFGWSRTAISGAFSLARVESGILGPIEGYLTDRVGAHRMLFVGLVICTLGFLALSWVDSLPMLYVVIVLGIVLGSSLGYNMPISVLIAKVFRERRSLARHFSDGSGNLRTARAFGRLGHCFVGLARGGDPISNYYFLDWVSDRSIHKSNLPPGRSADGEIRRRERALSTVTRTIERSAIHPGPSVAPQNVLVSIDGDGAAPHGYRRSVGSFRHSAGRPGWSTEAASSLLGLSALIGAPARVGMGWLGDLVDKRKLVMGLLLALSLSSY